MVVFRLDKAALSTKRRSRSTIFGPRVQVRVKDANLGPVIPVQRDELLVPLRDLVEVV
jgi:hypothetical protein